MIQDILTITRKEFLEIRRTLRFSSIFGWLLWLLMFGVGPALIVGPTYTTSMLPFLYWFSIAFMISSTTANNAFAGERERHTLETLLASRLPNNAILAGKITAATLYSLLFLVLCMLTALIALNIAHDEQQILMYSPVIAITGLLLGLTSAFTAACLSTLTSMYAPTMKQAAQNQTVLYLLLSVPYFLIGFISTDKREQLSAALMPTNNNTLLISLAIIVLLLITNLILYNTANKRFKRTKLINN